MLLARNVCEIDETLIMQMPKNVSTVRKLAEAAYNSIVTQIVAEEKEAQHYDATT